LDENDLFSSDNNNNNNKQRGPYKIPRRELAKREIRRLIIEEGLTNLQISERLNISERTVRRYTTDIFKKDSQVLINPAVEDIANQVSVFKERLARQYQDVISIARNPDVEYETQLAAHDLAANIDWVITRLSYETPAAIARHVKLDGTKLVERQNGLNLILKS
jgi:AraC-like DNA-binding protein